MEPVVCIPGPGLVLDLHYSVPYTAPSACWGAQGGQFEDEMVSARQFLQGCFSKVSQLVLLL